MKNIKNIKNYNESIYGDIRRLVDPIRNNNDIL